MPSTETDLVGYRVYQAASSSGPWTGGATITSATTKITDLAPGTVYWFRIAAVDAAGNESASTAPVSATPIAPPDTTAPSTPTGSVAKPGEGSVTLTWTPTTAVDLDSYRIYQAVSEDGPWTQAATTSRTTEAISDLAPDTTYWFRITAVDAAGNESAPTSPVSATPTALADTTAPPAPTGLTANPGESAVTLTWDASSAADLDAYRIYRAASSDGPWTQAVTTSQTAETISGLAPDTTYWFRITAVDAAGNESAATPAVSASPIAPPDITAPPTPTALAANPGEDAITLTWDASSAADLDAYRIYRAASSDGPWTQAATTSQTTETISDLAPDTTYWFRITAVDAAGNESAPTSPVSAALEAPPAAIEHCGLLEHDETWSDARVHALSCPVVVPAGITLTLEPDAVVKAGGGVSLTVAGVLRTSAGSSSRPVLTARADDTGGDTNQDGDASTPWQGAWSGIDVVAGGRADLSAVSVRYAYTGLAVREGASAKIRNGSFVDDRDGVTVSGQADIKASRFSGSTTGVTANDGSDVTVDDSTFTTSQTGVSILDAGTVVKNSSFDQIYGDTIKVGINPFDPGNIAQGNEATNSTINGVYLVNPVFADGARLFGGAKWALVISNRGCCGTPPTDNIPAGSTVTAPSGTVVKFRYVDHFPYGSSAGNLRVAGTLKATGSTVFTTFTDDTAGGDTDGSTNEPPYGGRNFAGIEIADGGRAELDSVSVRHASSGLTVEHGGSVTIRDSSFTDNREGITVSGAADVASSTFSGNTIGITANDGSAVTVDDSTFTTSQTGVAISDAGTTVSNSSFDQIYGDTIKVSAASVDPANFEHGNNATNSSINGVHFIDPVFADGSTLTGRDGWGVVISNYNWGETTQNVPKGATVTVPAGSVLKFKLVSTGGGNYRNGPGTLQVAGTLDVNGTASKPVAFARVNDDTVGGDTDNGDGPDPTWYFGSHFSGLHVLDGGTINLDHAELVQSGYGLSVNDGAHASVDHTTFKNTANTATSIAAGAAATIADSTYTGGSTGVSITDGAMASVTRTSFTSLTTGVQLGDRRATVTDSNFDQITGDTIKVSATSFDPANIEHGNSATNSTVNGVFLVSPVFADGATLFGRTGWGLVISNRGCCGSAPIDNIPAGSTVTAPAGTVVKFRHVDHFPNGSSTGNLRVAGTLKAHSSSIFTTFTDDEAGGDTDGNTNEPPYGGRNFSGIEIVEGGRATLTSASVRHAANGLTVYQGASADVRDSSFINNGNALTANGEADISSSTFSGNTTGVTANDGSDVTVDRSVFTTSQTGVAISDDSATVTNSSFDQIYRDTIAVGVAPFDPDRIAHGNSATNSAVNGVFLVSPVFADGATLFGRTGWGLVISNRGCCGSAPIDNIPAGSTVTAPPGTIVKFRYVDHFPNGSSTGNLRVAGTLKATGSTVFTSFTDDEAGGDTDGNTNEPLYGGHNFNGIHVVSGGRAQLPNASIRYAYTALTVDEGGSAVLHGDVLHSQVGVAGNGTVDATEVDWGSPVGPGPVGPGALVTGYGDISYFPWTGWTPPSAIVLPFEGSLPPESLGCSQYAVIGVRGSGESPYDAADDHRYGSWSDGFGEMLSYALTEGIVPGLKAKGLQDADIKMIGLRYEARHVPALGSRHAEMDVADLLVMRNAQFAVAYQTSIAQGLVRLDSYVTSEVARCPDQKLILIGYSQGALVIHNFLDSRAGSPELSRIAAVGLLADPARNGIEGQVFSDGFAPLGSDSWMSGTNGIASTLQAGSWRVPGTGPLSGSIRSHTISLCYRGDVVCAPGSGSPLENTHTNYLQRSDGSDLRQFGATLAATATKN